MPPERTAAQRTAALDRALQVRRERAALRDALKSGRARPIEVLEDPEHAGVRVRWFLQALPGVGPARAASMMTDLGIAESRRLGGLSDRQRSGLGRRLSAAR